MGPGSSSVARLVAPAHVSKRTVDMRRIIWVRENCLRMIYTPPRLQEKKTIVWVGLENFPLRMSSSAAGAGRELLWLHSRGDTKASILGCFEGIYLCHEEPPAPQVALSLFSSVVRRPVFPYAHPDPAIPGPPETRD